MSAGDRYAAELLRVVCPEDHGDPFEWWNPPVPAVAPPAAPDGPQGVRSLIARMRSAPRTKP